MLWEELTNFRPNCNCGKCTCGGVKEMNKYFQMEYIMSFLMGLHESFSQARGQILLMDPLPPINKVFALITQEENQRRLNTRPFGSDANGAAAFALKSDIAKSTTNTRFPNDSPRSANLINIRKNERPYCTHCKLHGHSIYKCYKIHGYPPGYRTKSMENFRISLLLIQSIKVWIVDSGATKHVCWNADAFMAMRTIKNASITLPNHEAATKKMIGRGDKVQDLYVLDIRFFNSVSNVFVGKVVAHIWHNRLGYLSIKRLEALKEHVTCDILKINKHLPCYICPIAKQRRLSFESNNNLSRKPFDLLHCDIWGPYHVPSHLGYRYFFTLVDDYSRFTRVYMLRQKYDAVKVVHRFFCMIATQYNANIKCFRSDNAHELSFHEFFAEKGVLHQFSCVERPQQNSVVEWKHQHLLNVARALFF
ncbi:uncharacterized protein LOC111381922 [Olea europaea var. sylvestris]|uniref:uncharacterized protein LOC111381922 n=1 Tax=Olea europaea var. sylvestris TaxID=158386 RepID=UPI000C1CCEF8|nr:uncharacterized protein LOC111381922 [Olea europaea var. sylvestris]